MNKTNTRKALNPAYRKHKPLRKDVNLFTDELLVCLKSIKEIDKAGESEEHIKEPIKKFFHNTFYKDNYINTKDRIDLAIYLGEDLKSEVGVIIETKKPSNKSEFLTNESLNRKALQELLLYYLRERIEEKNNNIKHLIATNGYEWFLFKGEDFYNVFYKNKALVKDYEAFRDGKKDSSNNELFYKEIATKYIAEVEQELPYVYLDFTKKNVKDYSDAALNTLYKVFSDVHLLGASFGNDSNQLNKSFYNELLHIIGLEETKDKGKKLINRKEKEKRDYGSILENAIFTIEDKDYLSGISSVESGVDKAFSAGLELTLTWINRVLFLKLLESQLLSYHKQGQEYRFLDSDFIKGFDDLNDLFFSALAKKPEERHAKYKERFKYIPYLNSSLFERSRIEKEAFAISALNDEDIDIYSQTVLKEANGKRLKGKLNTLDYLFQFLDAYDFATDGTEGIEEEREDKTLINASVLGLIFEKINGYKEGSFYTPAYITMYMSKETLRRAVVQKFKEQENEQIDTFEKLKAYTHQNFEPENKKRFNEIINSIRIVDPAVGSGHFLVSALNELICIKSELKVLIDENGNSLRSEIIIDNDELYITNEDGHLFEYKPDEKGTHLIQKTLFHEKQHLIENTLFGVDINPNSVKICRLRLWIELLKNAYYTEEMQLQTLPNIDINIKTGNSLISRFDLDDDLKSAFKGKEVKYSFTDYKNAVAEYKNTYDKKRKSEVLAIIDEVKNNFRSSLNEKYRRQVQKTEGDYTNEKIRLENLKAFEEQITKAEKDKLKGLKEKGERAVAKKDEIMNNIIYHNAFEWRFEFPEVLDDVGNYVGFDVVIGNPPYMRVQEIQKTQADAKDYYEGNYDVAKSSYDLANLFFERAIDIANFNSNCSYIFPHKFFNSKSTEQFRDYLTKGKYIDKLTHFGANMIFDEADTYTCIANYSKSENDGFSVYKAKFKENYQEKMLNNENYGFIKYEQLETLSELYGSNQWILLDGQQSVDIFQKIYQSKVRIKDNLDLFVGLQTSKDELYIGELVDETEQTYKLKFSKLEKVFEVEKAFFKAILKGKDVHRFSKLKTDLYVFFPYLIENKKASVILLSELEKEYPLTYKYVKENEAEFKKRESGKAGKMEHWHTYIYPKNLNKFEQLKLSSMEICSKHPNVTINNDYYHNTKVYSWVKKENTTEDYKYLLAIVNSKIMWWFLINTGDTLQGDARTFKTNYLNPFPLPKQISEEAQTPFIEKVNQILALKEADAKADTSELEREIDMMVYGLYGLSEEEILIVEGGDLM